MVVLGERGRVVVLGERGSVVVLEERGSVVVSGSVAVWKRGSVVVLGSVVAWLFWGCASEYCFGVRVCFGGARLF